MKRIFTLILCCAVLYIQAQTNVTFEIDMTGLTVPAAGVHVAGDFNGWNTSATPLTDQGGGIYSATVVMTAGTDVQYKYLNGDAWGTEESVPTDCSIGSTNRIFTVPASDVTLEQVAFAGCGVSTQDITFSVDMIGQTVSGNGVHIAGNFQNWNPGGTQLNLVSGTTYGVTVTVLSSISTIQYKYVNGNDWGGGEAPGAACINGDNNRFSDISAGGNITIPAEEYGACAAALPIELKDFSVRAQKSNVLLTWETSLELQTDYFLIEQSTDGRNFYPVHKETAAGDSEIEQYYEFTDENAHNGLNYYRLTTYDLDGTTHIEGVRTIEIKNQTSGLVTIYPNPAQSYLQVNLLASDQEQTLTITDTYGRVLETRTIAENSSFFLLENLDNLNAGVYYLQLQSGNEVTSKSFIKQ